MSTVYFEDEGFLDLLTGLLVQDRQFCRQFAPHLTIEELKPRVSSPIANDRWTLVSKALEHYAQYREPIGALLGAEARRHAKLARFDSNRTKELLKLARRYQRLKAPSEPIGDKVLEFRRQVAKAAAMEEILDFQAQGKLTDEAWQEITRKAIITGSMDGEVQVDYFKDRGVDDRIIRRFRNRRLRYPLLYIDPLDQEIRAISRGHLGLVLAPYKRGKSLFLLWVALAYIFQGLNVLYYTLEDALEEVEDRLDACITHLQIKTLAERPKTLKGRYLQYRRCVNNRLQLVDGTSSEITVARIEAEFLSAKENGFTADAIIIDYDDEILPERKHKDRRFEFAEIYRSLRRLAAKNDVLVWTASQTQRETDSAKIVSGENVAEDISKIRKASFALGLGQGDWGTTDAIYIYVAAHKHDKMHIGWNIMCDKERALIYDRVRTWKMQQKHANDKVVTP